MPLAERIKELESIQKEVGSSISPRLQEVLSRSGIESFAKQLTKLAPTEISHDLIEKGKKMVIVVKWPNPGDPKYNQLILSVREDAISFIGDHVTNQYLRLEGENIFRKDLIEEYLARTFVNPTRIEINVVP